MSANDYHLVSNWRVLGTVEEVNEIISDSAALARWWPAAFLDVLTLDKGDETGVNAIVRMETRGYLPYVLHWHLRVTETRPPTGFDFTVWGDFDGTGSWKFVQNGAWCDVTFDWQISVQKGLVKYLSFLGRPAFISNHRWAMERGEESLRLELARRHAADETARENIPPPPAPRKNSYVLPAGIAATLAGLVLLRRGRKRGS